MPVRNSIACALLCCLLLQDPSAARAICRMVASVEVRGGVQFDPTTMVLYVIAPQQVVGQRCQQPSAAGSGAVAPADGGPMMMQPLGDPDDGGADDGGREDDAGETVAPVPAPMAMPEMPAPGDMLDEDMPEDTSCPAALRVPVHGSVVHMVVQPSVLSTEGHAGLVMPVPARPDIHASNPDLFDALGERLQPRIQTTTELIEDESLGFQCDDPKFGGGSGGGCMGGDDDDDQVFDDGVVGDGRDSFYDPGVEERELQQVMIGEGVVKLERRLVTEDYDVTVLNASSADALDGWLDQNGFAHDDEDDAAFAAYVAEGAWFVALDVHPVGERRLSPLVVSFRGEEIPLMHRLQYDSDGGEIVTEAFVMAQTRMAAADGSAETLYAAPAGFGGEVAGFGLAQGWLTHLRFTRRMDEWLEDSTLVSTWNTEVRPVLERTERVLIPSSRCPRSSDSGACSGGGGANDNGCLCSAEAPSRDRFGGTLGPVLLACLWIALRGRRRTRR